ncbi:MAG: hypothetical protein ACLP5V_14305 [Candidatus Bathyarchaeia archaeon]
MPLQDYLACFKSARIQWFVITWMFGEATDNWSELCVSIGCRRMRSRVLVHVSDPKVWNMP